MKWIDDRAAVTDVAPLGPANQADLYPDPPSDEWCASYPVPDAEFIRRLEMALHHEAQPARRRAIIQKFLNEHGCAVIVKIAAEKTS
jgi:hypothetical protein